MALENITCYGCGGKGHLERDCTNTGIDTTGHYPDGTPKTLWCGLCDERTRLIGHDTVTRCQQCHPLARKQLKQFRRCPRCHATVYEWDNAIDCTAHAAPHATDRRPDRQHIRQITGAT